MKQDSSSELIEQIVDEFVERFHAHEPIRAEDLVDAHPDIADALAERLAAVEELLSTDAASSSNLSPNARRATEMEAAAPAQRPKEPSDDDISRTVRHQPIPGYNIEDEISRGGQGVVYRAVQISTNRRVAIKLLMGGALASESTKRRFEREIEIIAKLRHPGIVTVFDSGETREHAKYFVMDYVRGVPLDDYVRKKQLSTEQAVELFGSVCEAVAYAHQHGVIHRDLKPQNILVDDDGQPHVLDFGLAKPADGQGEPTLISTAGQIVGTLPYMSPEQARGDAELVDTRTDVYALGLLLYEVLTGAPPYSVTDHPSAVLRNITDAAPRRFSQVVVQSSVERQSPEHQHLPISDGRRLDELETIVFKALAKDSDRRYQTVRGLADDLARYLRGEPVEAKRDSRLYILRKTLARYKAGVAVAAVAIAVTALYAVSMSYLYNDARDQRSLALQRELVAKRQLYAAHMKLAQQAWQEARLNRVRELLDMHRPGSADQQDLRRFEWYYFDRLCRLEEWAGHVHGKRVLDVAFSPDGGTLASAGSDGLIVLWNVGTGEPLREWQAELGEVWALDVSHNGDMIAATGRGVVHLYDATTGALARQVDAHHDVILDVAFAPDGRTLATASSDLTARTWDVATGDSRLTLYGHTRFVSSVAFSPDGRLLASGSSDGLIKLWDAYDGRSLGSLKGHERGIYSLDFSPEGKYLASAGGHWDTRGELRVWDVERQEMVAQRDGHENGIWCVEFSPSGGALLTASEDQTVKLWSSPDLRPLGTLRGHTGFVYAARFSPDGNHIATSSWDTTIKLWNRSVLRQPKTVEVPSGVNDLAVSNDGTLLAAACSDNGLLLWERGNANRARVFSGHTGRVRCVAFADDASKLISASEDGTARVWSTAGGETLTVHAGHEDWIYSLAVAPDGSWAATGDRSGAIHLWHPENGETIASVRAHEGVVYALAVSASGRLLASTGKDRVVKVFAMPQFREMLAISPTAEEVYDLTFSPDGRRLAFGGRDRVVGIWNVETGELLQTFIGHGDHVRSLTFSPDGDTLAVGAGPRDPTIRLWDVETGLERATLAAHQDWVSALVFSPDGRMLYSASSDKTVRIWSGAIDRGTSR